MVVSPGFGVVFLAALRVPFLTVRVVPAAGAINAAVRIAPERIADLTVAQWVDVCQ